MLQNSSTKSFAQALIAYKKQNASFAPFVSNSSQSLESFSTYYVQDLIGEGPIAGLVNQNGEELLLFDDGNGTNEEPFKGLYLNDYVVKNNITNTFNYSRVNLYGKLGGEFQKSFPSSNDVKGIPDFSFLNPGIAYSLDKTIYGLNSDFKNDLPFLDKIGHQSLLFIKTDGVFSFKDTVLSTTTTIETVTSGRNQSQIEYSKTEEIKFSFDESYFSDANFERNFGSYHEIKDPNTDYLVLSLKLNSLFTTDKKGNTQPLIADFGILLGYKNNANCAAYIVHRVKGIATAPYVFDLYFDVSDFDFQQQPYIKVFNLCPALSATDLKTNRSLSSVSVIETNSLKFKYPNTCYFATVLDSRGFSSAPSRKFDLKLLQIKVPENYDAEAKVYSGFWNGEFDSILRWTDNPAWIIYDIITNYKYGLGKFAFQENLVDKWALYKIAKYCDEMVLTGVQPKYPLASVSKIAANQITLTNTSIANFELGKVLDIVNLNFTETNEVGEETTYYKSFRKIIVGISQKGGSVVLDLVNDFGLHKTFSLFPSTKAYIQKYVTTNERKYSQSYNKLVEAIYSSGADSSISDFINYMKSESCFDTLDLQNYKDSTGTAAAQFPNYSPLVEPRFTANITLDSETDVINLLNNVSSIFKGIVYWSNNFVNFDNDMPKESSYFFNNSNVQQGIFNYTSSSKDTRYTVAKITYADRADDFKDKTIYVEDQINIRKFGYIEKEIIGFGATSRGQAKRIGEWFLTTNQVEQEMVSFVAGPEALLLLPGDVISITDELKVNGRKGGRVVSVVDNVIVLDEKYDFISSGDTIAFIAASKAYDAKTLNEKSSNGTEITDAEINGLRPSYIYKFKVDLVGLDGNFRTQITLDLTGLTTEQQNLIKTIGPSTLWVYDKKETTPSISFAKQYRIVGIKEKGLAEFDISAIQFEKTKFNYIENKQNLNLVNLYSSDEDNSTKIIPHNILSLEDAIASGFVNLSSKSFNINDKYDYIVPALDYVDDDYSKIISVIEIFNNQIKTFANTKNSTCVGFVVEYVLNSKKISYVWRNGDNTSTTIAVPKFEIDNGYEFLRVYMIGKEDQFINPLS